MRASTKLIFAAFISFSMSVVVFGQDPAGSDPQKTAGKYIPEGMISAHQAVKGRFADSAGAIVVLYKKGYGPVRYETAVLTPQGSGTYDQHKLPEPHSTWSMMEPIAVFFANADGDGENELLVIDECYTGIGPTGARPFYRTRVYDWNGNSFVHLEALSEEIGNLNTATKVRNKLRQIARTSRLPATEMFQRAEFASYNEKIEQAAAAGEEWVKLPTQIIARLTGEFSDMRSRTIEITAPTAEATDSLTVTVTNDGYLDDSVRGEKFKYELKANQQGVWRFVSGSKAWRCQPGRGSQDYSTVKCT